MLSGPNHLIYRYLKQREYRAQRTTNFIKTQLLSKLARETLVYELASNEEMAKEFIFHQSTRSKSLSLYDMLIIVLLHPNLRDKLVQTFEFSRLMDLIDPTAYQTGFRLRKKEAPSYYLNNKWHYLHNNWRFFLTETLFQLLQETMIKDDGDFLHHFCKFQLQLADINSRCNPNKSVQKKKEAIKKIQLIAMNDSQVFFLDGFQKLEEVLNNACTLSDFDDLIELAEDDSSLAKKIYLDSRLHDSISSKNWRKISFIHSNIAEEMIQRKMQVLAETSPFFEFYKKHKKMVQYAAPHPRFAENLFKYYTEKLRSLDKQHPDYPRHSLICIEFLFILGLQQPWIAKEVYNKYYCSLRHDWKIELSTVISFVDIMKTICNEEPNADLKRKRLDEPGTSSVNEPETRRVRLG